MSGSEPDRGPDPVEAVEHLGRLRLWGSLILGALMGLGGLVLVGVGGADLLGVHEVSRPRAMIAAGLFAAVAGLLMSRLAGHILFRPRS